MRDDPETSNLIDRFTRFVQRQVSRRGFMKRVGAAGLALAAPLAGINRLLQPIPNVPSCPPICIGGCFCAVTSCITGGRSCTCTCEPVACECDPLNVKAVGTWEWSYELNTCVFACTCVAC